MQPKDKNLLNVDTSPDALQSDQQFLLAALEHLLEPMAKLYLAKGITIQSAEELLR